MHSQSLVLIFGLAWLASAVPTPAPLNINLGAYSPALVVGDGEISFGGAEGAGEAAGVQAVEAAQVAEAVPAGTGQVAVGETTTTEQTPATAQGNTLLQGMGKQRLPKD